MAELPYLNAPGYIGTTLEKMKLAPTPPKFTQDFLHTKLGITSSSARPIIPFLKKMGFISADHVPTERYRRFRNPQYSRSAVAEGMKEAFAALFESNEYAYDSSADELEGLVVQVTGLERGNQVLRAIVGSFEALKRHASFDGGDDAPSSDTPETAPADRTLPVALPDENYTRSRFNLSYTINLNLPESSNSEVFDAIFKSLRENLLKQ